ncbi:efflux RND transporter periplasmic adaptor subunit [Candidatus Synchoanobacter obligatus]|uniref:HlyD family efflux transporter periplasmic adaptor subunit n=1 Tax=Candidatus Synchoanobacter obligatus TaxID=2919597 RepID=A0ABT1L5E2_9GAMM|nr:efflux RND transporter periplasmic adaptor subunit [Candidatus Synchoanobacter obligatus]MCP8352392.1 HlyD family efflux transporter periplasmic adaptor subunit [Candidatus Synchoanobacter obligatus]
MDGSTKRTVIKIILITLVIWGILSITAFSPKTEIPTIPAERVDVLQASYQSYPNMVTVYGKVKALGPRRIDTEIASSIVSRPIQNGSVVEQHQLLALLDTTDLKIKQVSLEQDIEKFQHQIQRLNSEIEHLDVVIEHDQELLKTAEDDLERYQNIDQKFRSKTGLNQRTDTVNQRSKALQNSKKQRQTLVHQVDQAKSDLVQKNMAYLDNNIDISKAEIRSPMDGVISDLDKQVGDFLPKGSSLCAIIDPKNTYIEAYIPTIYYGQLNDQVTAKIQNEQHSSLQLVHVDPQVDEGQAHLNTQFHYEGEPVLYPIGQVVSIGLEFQLESPSIALPESAIYEEAFDYVYLVIDGALQKVNIQILGRLYQHHMTEYLVTSPEIKEGDLVVTSRLPRPKTGLKVSYE